jgi:hypothetical protein
MISELYSNTILFLPVETTVEGDLCGRPWERTPRLLLRFHNGMYVFFSIGLMCIFFRRLHLDGCVATTLIEKRVSPLITIYDVLFQGRSDLIPECFGVACLLSRRPPSAVL